MKIKTTALLTLLMPGIALLAACATDRADDSMNSPDTSSSSSMPAESGMDSSSTGSSMSGMSGMSGSEMSFADMDKNHDGSLTRDELSASEMLSQHFSTADADSDGKLSEAEVSKHRADMAASGH